MFDILLAILIMFVYKLIRIINSIDEFMCKVHYKMEYEFISNHPLHFSLLSSLSPQLHHSLDLSQQRKCKLHGLYAKSQVALRR